MQVSVAYFVCRHGIRNKIDWCGFESLEKLDSFLGESDIHSKIVALSLTNKITWINFKVPKLSSLNLNFISFGRVEESMVDNHRTCVNDDGNYYYIWIFKKKNKDWILHSSFVKELQT